MSEVIVYSASWCGACKNLMKSLDEKGVNYRMISLDSADAMRDAKEVGIRAIPTTVVNGQVVKGGSQESLNSILALRGESVD